MKQRLELKRLLAPQMRQSLKVLALPLPDLNELISQELENNPILEESQPQETIIIKVGPGEGADKQNKPLPTLAEDEYYYQDSKYSGKRDSSSQDFQATLISKKMSLQDVLLRQLGIFTASEEDFTIGQEIIGNIDENGYLKATLEEMAKGLNLPLEKIETVLGLIQQFEPHGVASRSISECLLNQLKLSKRAEPILEKVIKNHLEDVAKKRFNKIAKSLKQPLEVIENLVKKIGQLDPKPGRNYSTDHPQYVVPDITIDQIGDELKITINNEHMPTLRINRTYRNMLKQPNLDQKTKDFLTEKLRNALELVRSISRRQSTLYRIIETIMDIQKEAIKTDLAHLKPLTFQEVAKKIDVHETTVCRAVMNKYIRLPFGVVALKDFFSSSIQDKNGQDVSSTYIKKMIKDLIGRENKREPLSDQDITKALADEKNLKLSRRTVAKYREDLKIPSTSFRRER